ncbi:MAG: Ppx/GppA family phosphatase [Aquabacterium sp.]|nr:MAG: Ppx/GppA family phosphatase [Aquabacterium sp.]
MLKRPLPEEARPDDVPDTVAPSRFPDLLAAIDIGSNSFRLEIAQVKGASYKRVDYLKEAVRLGGGLDGEGMLTEAAVTRGLTCLQRFAQRLEGFELHQVRAVATQTLREARNRDAFLARGQAVLGYPIEVISGREEARLIYAGVARLQPSTLPRLVIDIGGRSTEMILGQGRATKRAESFQIGSVSLSMRYFGDGRYTEAGFRAAQIAAGAELEEAVTPFARSNWQEALGSSGTVSAVSGLLAASNITDGSITPDGLRWCIEQCLRAGRIERLELPGLKPDRKAVLAGGLSILYTLAIQFDIEALHPARGALRQGVIFDLDQRHESALMRRPNDLRESTVREMQHRFGVDLAQAERVRSLALELYAECVPAGAPGARSRVAEDAQEESVRELGWAASLHEIGMMVSHHDFHRHGAYLLNHVDAAGFSQSQQRRVGELVLGQRGSLRKLGDRLAVEPFLWQVLSLRLAAILCHGRVQLDRRVISLRRRGTQVSLQVRGPWAQEHLRTLHLLDEEAAVWADSGVLKLGVRATG